MIMLNGDTLRFAFPGVHEEAILDVDLQRTLRIPDDGTEYPLPPGLGRFPLRHVDDFARQVPSTWLTHGGVVLPMYQSEALWLNLSSDYPFAVKVATGRINAVSGETWTDGLHGVPQDYLVVPEQPWLDGYSTGDDLIRQFVAMPLGSGYSVEEQLTGEAEHGGLQLIVYPMKRESYERMRVARPRPSLYDADVCYSAAPGMGMGLAPGGRMRQQIYEDPYEFPDWDHDHSSRCFVHLANSLVWRSITGEEPPPTPVTAAAYTSAGLPWFDYYEDAGTLSPSGILKQVKSVTDLAQGKGDVPLPENQSVDIAEHDVVRLRRDLRPDQVREGHF
jgi:hypothetical protein